ncbi:Six-hairpin glycosidase-like protein [Plectosphaerella cucumerina]|uniref:Six-hairpin glycosidase-like protein n=1 Tax=Plectosphaerella cucumerina TaxID=40658 RepID=A0A8K0TDH7_9PEZI|nr:Six-hairpin glycosidase-like protein [Plectosphaerella cucumerina]
MNRAMFGWQCPGQTGRCSSLSRGAEGPDVPEPRGWGVQTTPPALQGPGPDHGVGAVKRPGKTKSIRTPSSYWQRRWPIDRSVCKDLLDDLSLVQSAQFVILAMEITEFGSKWIWHPDWVDSGEGAGQLLHFRKHLDLEDVPQAPVLINVTADTRYKLYVNSAFVQFGPVKGDEDRWFYDTVNIQPYLRRGRNTIAVHVLRFYHATMYATSFARLPIGGLYIRQIADTALDEVPSLGIDTDAAWETALDPSVVLRTDEPYDIFLHIFESVDRSKDAILSWEQAAVVVMHPDGYGVLAPWNLCPRQIPFQTMDPVSFETVHNVRSDIGDDVWARLMTRPATRAGGVVLPAGSVHHVELEAPEYLTALLSLHFRAGSGQGSTVTLTYSECYEDEPFSPPFGRSKGDRRDTTKKIIGPSDRYIVGGPQAATRELGYGERSSEAETLQPFQYRAFRFIALDIEVSPTSSLVIEGFDLVKTTYPLAQLGSVESRGEKWVADLWSISVNTLKNCMHDCYEDCPFYEQMQYPMDTRSSALFTYLVSGDDRLPKQAMLQMKDSFIPSLGMITSRNASSMQKQVIPPFSCYWICMVVDHYEYFADKDFARQMIGVCDAVLQAFADRVDGETGLVRRFSAALWEYTDWTTPWVPNGVPPASIRTGFSTYINCLYSYTLRRMAMLLTWLGRPGVAGEYVERAETINAAVLAHCYDGEFFTDGLAERPVPADEYSLHAQIWAVLSGCVAGDDAARLLTESFARGDPSTQQRPLSKTKARVGRASGTSTEERRFTMYSISFSFYAIRALAAVGSDVYNRHFYDFWGLWRAQVASNLLTWPEDAVNVRSDCHAWGSVPIHELVTEVAGIRPGAPGWAEVHFEPRVSVLRCFEARVPVRSGDETVLLQVKWAPGEGSRDEGPSIVDVELALRAKDGGEIQDGRSVRVKKDLFIYRAMSSFQSGSEYDVSTSGGTGEK